MSVDCFYQLTPLEFEIIYKQWQAEREARYEDEWEKTRFICYVAAAPYLKRRQNIKSFMPFPWDNPVKKELKKDDKPSRNPERFKSLKEKYGNTI